VLLIPGYLNTLSVEQRADGFFDRWFSLTMPFHFAEDIQQELKESIQHVGTVSEALETAIVWAALHSQQPTTRDEQSHQPLFSVLIGEWKQFRQVNSSATPVSLPEWRELTFHARSLPALFTAITLGADYLSKGFGSVVTAAPVAADIVYLRHLPFVSGMAIAAP